MHRTLPYISLFVVTVLLQVFLFDNLSISIYLNPLVYVAFVALLPLDTPPVALLASDRKSTRLNSSHNRESRMPSSA